MASTYSTNLALELIGSGDQSGTWGTTTNTNLGTLIEQAISGYVTQAVSTGTDTTITIPSGASGVARNMIIEMTGTGGANTNLIVPSNKKLYFVFNNTSSGQVTVKVAAQTGVSVPNGKKVLLASNGTDIVEQFNQVVGNLAVGGTLGVTGAATLASTVAVTGAVTLTTALGPASGGTGLTAVGTSGNVLTSNGTAWTSSAPAASVTSIAGTANQITLSAATGAVTVSIPSNGNGFGVRTVSSSAASGGSSGDIWYQI